MYAYLLGLYLGDGNIWRTGRASWRLCLTLDARYPKVIAEARVAVSSQTPTPVRVNAKSGAVLILASSPMWPGAFPQHGPGQKYRRKIKLQPWQEGITRDYPKALLRGLIHSDGCRTINRFETRLPSGRLAQYAYPRYFFTNHSEDIRGIFCRHCDLLGIRWTRSNPRNISVSQRRSVARLDEFIGPKR